MDRDPLHRIPLGDAVLHALAGIGILAGIMLAAILVVALVMRLASTIKRNR